MTSSLTTKSDEEGRLALSFSGIDIELSSHPGSNGVRLTLQAPPRYRIACSATGLDITLGAKAGGEEFQIDLTPAGGKRPAASSHPDDDTLAPYVLKRQSGQVLRSAALLRDVLAQLGRPATRDEITAKVLELPVRRYWSRPEYAVEAALRRAVKNGMAAKLEGGRYELLDGGEAET